MDHADRFRRSLVHLLQTGAFQEMLGCSANECAKVEFHLKRSYHVHLKRRHIVVHECDRETVRRHRNGRWTTLRPSTLQRRRLVLDRASGTIVHAPEISTRHARP